jgi:hypothetical protein
VFSRAAVVLTALLVLLAIPALLDGAWVAGFTLIAAVVALIVRALREYGMTAGGLRAAILAIHPKKKAAV